VRYSENAESEDYRCCCDGDRWKRNDFRCDNSHCSHERQTDEWLARRTEQVHPVAFSLIPRWQGKPQSRAAITETLKCYASSLPGALLRLKIVTRTILSA
jgi:hypothetical protein